MSDALTKHKSVVIHVDRERYESESPTTGSALRLLASVPVNRELFKEEQGDVEDSLIGNDQKIDLKSGDHFYSWKAIRIIVNAKKKDVTETRLSFDALVKLAFETPPYGPNTQFTITYRGGPRANPEGTLTEGNSVQLKNGMVFNVTPTDKS